MDIDNAEDMFYKTRDSLGLSECTFQWSWARGFKGCFRRRNGKCAVRLSKLFVEERSEYEVKQVMLHELAHLIDYKKYGDTTHDDVFKQICSDIGCSELGAERQYRVPIIRYVIICQCCGCILAHRERLHRELRQSMKCEIYCRNNLFDTPLLREAIIVKTDEYCRLNAATYDEWKNTVMKLRRAS